MKYLTKELMSLVCGLMLMMSSSASASLIEYSTNFVIQNEHHRDLTLNRFDSSLGKLTDVSISFSSNFNHWVTTSATDSIKNFTDFHYYNNTSAKATGELELEIGFLDPFGVTKQTKSDKNIASCSARNNDLTATSNSSQSTVKCDQSVNDLNNWWSESFDLSALALDDFLFTDIDQFLNFRALSDLNLTRNCDSGDKDDFGTRAGDSCSHGQRAYWEGYVTVSYTYDERVVEPKPSEVPEPSTLAIFSLGMMGLVSRRFKKQY